MEDEQQTSPGNQATVIYMLTSDTKVATSGREDWLRQENRSGKCIENKGVSKTMGYIEKPPPPIIFTFLAGCLENIWRVSRKHRAPRNDTRPDEAEAMNPVITDYEAKAQHTTCALQPRSILRQKDVGTRCKKTTGCWDVNHILMKTQRDTGTSITS